jgi:hypothetical protein
MEAGDLSMLKSGNRAFPSCKGRHKASEYNRNIVSLNSYLFNLDMNLESTLPGAIFDTLEHLVHGRDASTQTNAGTGIEIGMVLLGLTYP